MLLAQAGLQAIFISGPRWLRSGNANIVSKEQLRVPVEASMESQSGSREGSARSIRTQCSKQAALAVFGETRRFAIQGPA